MPDHTNHKWRKLERVFTNSVLQADDWSLLNVTGDHVAYLFNTGEVILLALGDGVFGLQ